MNDPRGRVRRPQLRPGTIAAVSDQLTTDGQALDDRAHTLLGDGWQGDAAGAFRDGYDEWATGRRDVVTSPMTIGRLVDEANQRFATTDEGVDGTMAQLHARLGGGE